MDSHAPLGSVCLGLFKNAGAFILDACRKTTYIAPLEDTYVQSVIYRVHSSQVTLNIVACKNYQDSQRSVLRKGKGPTVHFMGHIHLRNLLSPSQPF